MTASYRPFMTSCRRVFDREIRGTACRMPPLACGDAIATPAQARHWARRGAAGSDYADDRRDRLQANITIRVPRNTVYRTPPVCVTLAGPGFPVRRRAASWVT